MSFTMIFLLVFVIGGALFYHSNTKLLRENAENNAFDALAVIAARIDDRLQNMDNLLKRIQVNQRFREITRSIPESDGNYFDAHPMVMAEVNELFLDLLVSEDLSTEAYYVTRYGDFIGTRMSVVPYSRVESDADTILQFGFVQRGLATDAYRLFVAPRENEWLNTQQSVYSVVRPIRDNDHVYGVLEISQNVKVLRSLMKIDDYQDQYSVYLLAETGNPVLQYGESDLPELPGTMNTHGTWNAPSGAFGCYQRLDLTGWTLVLYSDFREVAKSIRSFGYTFGVIYFCLCVAIMGFFYIIATRLTRPLTRLKEHLEVMQWHEQQDEKLAAQQNGNEIAVLSEQIERILTRIRQQNETIVRIKKQEMQAQMNMLETHLSPHFLYNALSVIGASAYEDGAGSAYRMCNALAALLRYTVRSEHQAVSLANELENVRQYLAIMQMRYENVMEVEWDIEGAVEDVVVPKLIIQPIVENCFKHGFNNWPPVWKMSIHAEADERRWSVGVSNNGKPFTEDAVRRLDEAVTAFRSRATAEEQETQHFGLENTLKRLYLQYGEQACYTIDVRYGWTHVVIGGPAHGFESRQNLYSGG